MAGLGLNAFSDMRFGDGQGLKEFALVHRLSHDAAADAIVTQLGAVVPGFDVGDDRARAAWELLMLMGDKAPREAHSAVQPWLLLHAQLHQAEYDAIGFGSAPDLSTVDFSSERQFAAWMQEHQQAHDQISGALGISQ